jgi:hypothetical protein
VKNSNETVGSDFSIGRDMCRALIESIPKMQINPFQCDLTDDMALVRAVRKNFSMYSDARAAN